MNLCSIASGSSGNCIYVGSDKTSILVDAGISGKRIEQGLNSIERTTKDCDAILITHEHSDHVKGLGVLARKYHIPIYCTKGTMEELKQMSMLGKMPEGLYRPILAEETFSIGDLSILPFEISHDAAEPVGYRVSHGEKSVGIATDMGVYDEKIVENLQGLDALLLEANHDINLLQVGSYPYSLKMRILGEKGHLSNDASARLIEKVLHPGLQHILLGHLSKENNFPELAYQTVSYELEQNPVWKKMDTELLVADRMAPTKLLTIQ